MATAMVEELACIPVGISSKSVLRIATTQKVAEIEVASEAWAIG